MEVVSVDSGKRFIKLASKGLDGKIETDSFETKMTELNDLNDIGIIGDKSLKVEYKDRSFVLGTQGKYDSLHERTKKSDLHKIATLTAITKALKNKDAREIALVNCIPGTSFKSKDIRKMYADYYSKDKNVEIKVNDREYSFEIKDVLILPEGAGFVFLYPNLCMGKTCIIDIGGFNIGLTVCEDGEIIDMISLDFGGVELEKIAIELLESKYDAGFDKRHIFSYLQKGYVERWGQEIEGSREIISLAKYEYIKRILKESAYKKIYLARMNSNYFIGGTPHLLKSEIENHDLLGKTGKIMSDGKFINVMGNLAFGIRNYNGK